MPDKVNQHIFIFGMALLFLPFLLMFAFTGNLVYLAFPFAFFLFYAGWQSFSFIYLLLLVSLPWSSEISLGNSFSTDFPDEPFMGNNKNAITYQHFASRYFNDIIKWVEVMAVKTIQNRCMATSQING